MLLLHWKRLTWLDDGERRNGTGMEKIRCAALNLMDLDYAKRCGFFLEPLRCPIPLRGIDATPLAKNKPQYWAQLTMCMAPAHQEVIRFLDGWTMTGSVMGTDFHIDSEASKVVLASVPGSNINVAVKMISKRDNEDTIIRERQILLAARHCPFLCHLYAAHQSQHRAYFITEYLSGGSLEDLIRMCGCLNIGNVRDIKPDNIMLDADGHIRIIDLGLAQDGVTSSKNISGVTGTFHYMAPEVHRRKRYGAAVDWWSLGIVVSRMAAGRSPFYNGPIKQMAFKAIINEKPKFPSWLDADVKHLIKKLLRKDPQRRLGVSGNIREHPFFTTIGWEDLEERRVEPPFTPFRPVLENHHLQWPEHTVLHPVVGFTYVSPSWAR
ncbi:unnamed protein product [Ranitomeya imitator]|uniref:Protein kinase domain-containing protein n=1 Tax=Ranitomeya imitator TaxID=111125 RepID=A0ABN9KRC1_9NEOB|nr:unnamed protein product [Ranitomeya imitator]